MKRYSTSLYKKKSNQVNLKTQLATQNAKITMILCIWTFMWTNIIFPELQQVHTAGSEILIVFWHAFYISANHTYDYLN